MILSVEWRGDVDGDVVLVERVGDDESKEWTFDRPGDLVAALMRNEAPEDSLLASAGAYGICLASRGITEPLFIRQIVDKSASFVSSAHPSSLVLFRTVTRFRELVRDSSNEGVDLRREILEEAHRISDASGSADDPNRGDGP